jgi:cation transport ATPase
MKELESLLDGFKGGLEDLIVPVATIGLFLWGISFLLSPLLPDWAQGMKSYFQKACLIMVVLGMASTLVEILTKVGK